MRGLFIGRFQPFHKGHLYVIELMKKECDTIIIGIGSAQKERELDNPLSGGERIEMIKRVLDEKNLPPYELYPVPDIDCYPAWPHYVKTILPPFDVIYANSDIVAELFERIGVKVKRIDNKNRDNWKGREIRRKIQDKEDWKRSVPKEVVEYFEEINMEERIKPQIPILTDTEREVAHLLTKKGLSIATAESCTGGLIAHRLTNVPGSSSYLQGGVITYSNETKIEILGVDSNLIEKKGAVCQEVAEEMAKGVREYMKTDIGLAVTGIAGPGGGIEGKPVGTVHYAIDMGKNQVHTEKLSLQGNRKGIKDQTSEFVLRKLVELIK